MLDINVYFTLLRGLVSLAYKFFDKKTSGVNTSGGAIKSGIMLTNNCQNNCTNQVLENLKND